MRQLPQRNYSGLTVILDRLYRFDTEERKDAKGELMICPETGTTSWPSPLKSSTLAGSWFDDALIRSGHRVSRASIEVRTLDSLHEPFLAGTTCVLALGEGCAEKLLSGVSLGEQRGSPWMYPINTEVPVDRIGGVYRVPFIFSYAPQDAEDRTDYFSEDSEEEDEVDESNDGKRKGVTRRKNWKWWAKKDIAKACRIAKEGLRKYPEPNFILWPKAADVISALKATTNDDFYCDIENLDDLRFTCFGFSFGNSPDVYVVPWLQTHVGNTYYYTNEECYLILHALGCALLRNRLVSHQAKHELFAFLWRYGLPWNGKVYCTMLSFSRVYIEIERSLGHIISLLTDLPYHKGDGVFKPWNRQQAEDLYRYNAKDVWTMKIIKPEIDKEADRLGATESVELVNRGIAPYQDNELKGARVHWAEANRICTYNTRMLRQIELVIDMMAGYPLNPRSHQAVGKYLYDKKGLGIKKPAQDPTNEKTLRRLLLGHDVPLIPWILKYRQISKEGYLGEEGERRGKMGFDGWERPSVLSPEFIEKRFCTHWKFTTVTFRRASSKRKIGFGNNIIAQFGDNFQNFSKDLRGIIVPDEGYSLGQVDESGADAMIVAYLCEHGQFRELFLNGIKPHTFLALHLFKDIWRKYFKCVDEMCLLQIKDIKKHPRWKGLSSLIAATDEWSGIRYYFIAKQICHSSNYGIGVRTFRTNLLKNSEGTVNLSEQEGKQFLEFFHKLFPEVRRWHKETVKQLENTRILRNRFGHPRYFAGRIEEAMYKEAYAFDPQSSVGAIIFSAVCELWERKQAGDELLVEADYQFLQDGHDALFFQARTPFIELVTLEVQKHINREMTSPRGEKFTMRSSAQIGIGPTNNWKFKALDV